MNQELMDKLFVDLMARAGKKGFECQRKGGSNGLTRCDKPFMQFLATPGNFPRPSRNIVILQGQTKWECLYISTNNRDDTEEVEAWNQAHPKSKLRVARKDRWNHLHPHCPIDNSHPFFPVKWSYTPPVVGGSFFSPRAHVLKYPFVFEFTECKLKTAYIIEALQGKYVPYKIAPGCLHTEHEHFLTALYKYQTRSIGTQRYKKYKKLKKREHILFAIMCLNKFTLVTHPVGMHEDVFGNNDESYENKVTGTCSIYTHSMGRGGNGFLYTWGLLDWSSTSVGRRRRVYLQLGGDDNLTLRADVWLNWLGEDNYRNLRRMVGLNPEYRGSELLPPSLRNLSQDIAPLPP